MRLAYKSTKRIEIINRLNTEDTFFKRLINEMIYGSKYLLLKQFVNHYNLIFKDTSIDFEQYSIVWDGILLSIENDSKIIFAYGPNGGQKPTFYQYKKPHVATRLFKFWEEITLNDVSEDKFPYDLFPDPLYCVLKLLPIKDRLNCRSVSKYWCRIGSSSRLWGGFEFKDFILYFLVFFHIILHKD